MSDKIPEGITVRILEKIYALPFAAKDTNHINHLAQNIEEKIQRLQEALPSDGWEKLLIMQLLLQEDTIEDYKNKNQDRTLINTVHRLQKIEEKIQSIEKSIKV